MRLVIFDLDGTLIRLPINYGRLKCEISRILGADKISSITNAVLMAGVEEKKKIFEIWDSLEIEALSSIEIIEKGINMYYSVHDKIRCLVTLQGRHMVSEFLKKTGLIFDYIVTREDCIERKGQLKIIIEKFKIDPSKILVVGDRESDREAAETLGCKFKFINDP